MTVNCDDRTLSEFSYLATERKNMDIRALPSTTLTPATSSSIEHVKAT